MDILVEFTEPMGLLFVHLADYLEEILPEKVDLLTPDAIKPKEIYHGECALCLNESGKCSLKISGIYKFNRKLCFRNANGELLIVDKKWKLSVEGGKNVSEKQSKQMVFDWGDFIIDESKLRVL